MFVKESKGGRSLYFVMIAIFCFLLSSSLASATEEELNRVKNEISEKGHQWGAGETSISRLPEDQRVQRLGLKKRAVSLSQNELQTLSPEAGAILPATLDYRNYNGLSYVTPIKNQGNCGSCWAFATTAALESQVLMTSSLLTDEAEQILVSCSGAGSCSGGYIDRASNFIQSTGLPPEQDYPYTATNGSCSNAVANWQSSTERISGWQWVTTTAPTVDLIKSALVNYGPLVTTMNVYSDFYYYTGGVYSLTAGSTYEGGHAIEIIGYDDNSQSFIVKNSWGTGWGESGFFQIAYNQLTNAVAFGQYTISYNSSNNIITQCSYTVSPTSVSSRAAGGSGTINVTTQSSCTWSAKSNSSWITITSGGSGGTASGSVGYTAQTNTTGRNRTGTMTIAGQTVTVWQNKR
jgi:C1A family cysteine protease